MYVCVYNALKAKNVHLGASEGRWENCIVHGHGPPPRAGAENVSDNNVTMGWMHVDASFASSLGGVEKNKGLSEKATNAIGRRISIWETIV